MKKLIPLVVLLTVAVGAFVLAQDASLTTPVTRTSETKYVVGQVFLDFTANVGYVETIVRDAGNNEIRRVRVQAPGSACSTPPTWTGLLNAMGTARGGETGVPERRGHFRILGYLSDNGCLPASTINP